MLTTDNLIKRYGDLAALDGVSLEVKKGELFGLLGPNGSGKTTLIKCLTGQTKPSSGSCTVLGHDPAKDGIKVREKAGIIPEQETPPSFLTADEYLEFVCRIRKIKPRYDEWFEMLDFASEKNVLCKDLSRGTRQKLMIAQAFLHSPDLAFIDEPLINLDPIMQKRIRDYFQDFVKKGGTIFLSTHVLEIAQAICTRVAIINKGKIVYTGHTKKLEKTFMEKCSKK